MSVVCRWPNHCRSRNTGSSAKNAAALNRKVHLCHNRWQRRDALAPLCSCFISSWGLCSTAALMSALCNQARERRKQNRCLFAWPTLAPHTVVCKSQTVATLLLPFYLRLFVLLSFRLSHFAVSLSSSFCFLSSSVVQILIFLFWLFSHFSIVSFDFPLLGVQQQNCDCTAIISSVFNSRVVPCCSFLSLLCENPSSIASSLSPFFRAFFFQCRSFEGAGDGPSWLSDWMGALISAMDSFCLSWHSKIIIGFASETGMKCLLLFLPLNSINSVPHRRVCSCSLFLLFSWRTTILSLSIFFLYLPQGMRKERTNSHEIIIEI